MNISAAFIKGLAFGLEYVDLDEEDGDYLKSDDANMMIVVSLGFLRFVYINGSVGDAA